MLAAYNSSTFQVCICRCTSCFPRIMLSSVVFIALSLLIVHLLIYYLLDGIFLVVYSHNSRNCISLTLYLSAQTGVSLRGAKKREHQNVNVHVQATLLRRHCSDWNQSRDHTEIRHTGEAWRAGCERPISLSPSCWHSILCCSIPMLCSLIQPLSLQRASTQLHIKLGQSSQNDALYNDSSASFKFNTPPPSRHYPGSGVPIQCQSTPVWISPSVDSAPFQTSQPSQPAPFFQVGLQNASSRYRHKAFQ